MISNGVSRVWPKALYNLRDRKARATFLLLSPSPPTRSPGFPTFPGLPVRALEPSSGLSPGLLSPWSRAAEVLQRPRSFSVDCSRLFLSQAPCGLFALSSLKLPLK